MRQSVFFAATQGLHAVSNTGNSSVGIRMKKYFGAVVCVLMMASSSAFAESVKDFKSLAGFIEKTKGETLLPSGTAVAIVKEGKLIYEGYFGFSDIEHKVPVTRDTVFYIASTTKPFMALNTLLMEEQGRITTGTSLQQMFPEMHFSDRRGGGHREGSAGASLRHR